MGAWTGNQIPLPQPRPPHIKLTPPFSSIVAATDALELMHVFALGNDGSLWHAYETSVGNWTIFNSVPPPNAAPRSISLIKNGGGQLELFATDLKSINHMFQLAQPNPGTAVPAWSNWSQVSAAPPHAVAIAAQTLNGSVYVCCLTPAGVTYITSGAVTTEPIAWSAPVQLNVEAPGMTKLMWISPDPHTLPVNTPGLSVLVLGYWEDAGSLSPLPSGFYLSPMPAPSLSNFAPIPAQPPPSTIPQEYPNTTSLLVSAPQNAAAINYQPDGLLAVFVVDGGGCLYLLRQAQIPTGGWPDPVRTEWVYQYAQQLPAGSCWCSNLGSAPLAVCEDHAADRPIPPRPDRPAVFPANHQIVFYADNTGTNFQALEYAQPHAPQNPISPNPYTPPYFSASLGTIGSAPNNYTIGPLTTAYSSGGGVTVFALMQDAPIGSNPSNIVWYWRK